MHIYIHVPFCRSKCRYCAFYSEVMNIEEVERYREGIIKEISHYRSLFGRKQSKTVYFGGGTPTLVPSWAMEPVIRALQESFPPAPGAEFTFEANPDCAIDSSILNDLLSYGVNRLSIGAQSLLEQELKILGRTHTSGTVLAAVERARLAGFSNIGLDFIFGVPGGRLKLWLDSLREAVKMPVEHFSCYGLTVEEGTLLKEDVQLRGLSLPDDEETGKMFMYGAELLEEHGFLQYEISNFARMGYACQHNQAYWSGKDYLGFGPSAVSTVNGRRWENPKDIKTWLSGMRGGSLDQNAHLLTPEELSQEMVMLSLRTAQGLSLGKYRKCTGKDFVSDNAPVVQALRGNGLIRISGGYLRLSRKGMLVSNAILGHLKVAPLICMPEKNNI